MATTDENKAARTQQSREVAQDAAEAYRAAVSELLGGMEANRLAMDAVDQSRLTFAERNEARRGLRTEARRLAREARGLGIERTVTADKLGVSRQTIHEWLNEGESWMSG